MRLDIVEPDKLRSALLVQRGLTVSPMGHGILYGGEVGWRHRLDGLVDGSRLF